MTITLTVPMIVFIVSMLAGWTGFLLGAIKWLLNRQLIGIETKIADSEKKASDAALALSAYKDANNAALANMRLEFSQRQTCGNHPRMEDNDVRLFKSLDKLHGDMRELLGTVNGVSNTVTLLSQFHMKGENP